MQYVNLKMTYSANNAKHREYTQNVLLLFKNGFYYDEDWLNYAFWYTRNGSPGEGARRYLFTDTATGSVLLDLGRNSGPTTMTGYHRNKHNPVFGVGYTVRFDYDTGRPVYRNFPCALGREYIDEGNSNSLMVFSSQALHAINNYYAPRQSQYFDWCLNPNADLNIVQHKYPSRTCVGVEVVSINIERRFKWV